LGGVELRRAFEQLRRAFEQLRRSRRSQFVKRRVIVKRRTFQQFSRFVIEQLDRIVVKQLSRVEFVEPRTVKQFGWVE
jgi:hypothetical protein